MKMTVIVQDQDLDQLKQRYVGVDLPAKPAKDGKVLYGFFKRIGVISNIKRAKLP